MPIGKSAQRLIQLSPLIRDDAQMVKRIADLDDSRLRILARASSRGLPPVLTETNYELQPYAELIELGYLDGWIVLGNDGRPIKIADLKITSQGEEFLDEHTDIPAPSQRVLSKEMYVFLECISGYLLVLGFFFLIKMSEQTSSAPPQPNPQLQGLVSAKSNETFVTIKEVNSTRPPHESSRRSSFSNWTVGVCGLPPLE